MESGISIYGSVSTTDIANKARELVAHNDEAAKILFNEDNIRLPDLQAAEDRKRIKRLGEFEVEIMMKGADAKVVRNVRVLQQAS